MVIHNMVTRASMVIDARLNHEIRADLTALGIDTGLVSLQFLAKPWSVDGKPIDTPVYHKPLDPMTRAYQIAGINFYPVPYAGSANGKMVPFIACDDDTPVEAIEYVLQDIKEMLYGYFFFDTVKLELIEALGL